MQHKGSNQYVNSRRYDQNWFEATLPESNKKWRAKEIKIDAKKELNSLLLLSQMAIIKYKTCERQSNRRIDSNGVYTFNVWMCAIS